MSALVEVGSSLILPVARSGQGREIIEVKIAVDHIALRGNGVGENAAAAVVADVTAVVGGSTTVGAAALLGDLVKDVGNLSANAGRRVLEKLLHLGGGSARSNVRSSTGQLGAVAQSGPGNREAVTSAVALDAGALLMTGHDFGADNGSLIAVNIGSDSVGGKGNRADELVVSLVGKLQDAVGDHLELATGGQVVGLGSVKGNLNRLSSRNLLEVGILEALDGETETDTVELNSLASSGDVNLLNGSVVEDGTSLEDLEVLLAVVGDSGLDLRVASHLELHIKRSWRTRGGCSGQRGKGSKSSEELHCERYSGVFEVEK